MRTAAALLLAALALGLSTGCGGSSRGGGPDELTRFVLEPTGEGTDQQLDLAVQIMRHRLDRLHVDPASVERDNGRIVVIVPRTGKAVAPVVMRRGLLEFFDLQGDLVSGVSADAWGNPLPLKKPPKLRPGTVVITCRKPVRFCPNVGPPTRTLYYLFHYEPGNADHPIPELTGEDLDVKGTRQDFGTQGAENGEPIVLMQFTGDGAKKFEDVTRTLAKRGRTRFSEAGSPSGEEDGYAQQFAIVLDHDIKSAPTVGFLDNPNGISAEHGVEITGLGSLQETKDLALVLQTGALPLELRVVSSETGHRID